jgi:hypothetical protein
MYKGKIDWTTGKSFLKELKTRLCQQFGYSVCILFINKSGDNLKYLASTDETKRISVLFYILNVIWMYY